MYSDRYRVYNWSKARATVSNGFSFQILPSGVDIFIKSVVLRASLIIGKSPKRLLSEAAINSLVAQAS